MALVTPGNTYQIDLQNSSNGTVVQTTTNKYTVNPVTTFKGYSATELQVDTVLVTAAVGAGTTTQIKHYASQTGSTYSSYGTVAQMSIPGFGSYTMTAWYTPPIQTPMNLTEGQTYTVSYTVKTESSMSMIPAVPDVAVNYSMKYLGKEQVTTPAGTYQTCKTQTTSVSSGSTSVSTEWIVAEGRYRGLMLKADSGNGATSVATRLLFNGS